MSMAEQLVASATQQRPWLARLVVVIHKISDARGTRQIDASAAIDLELRQGYRRAS